MRLKLEDFKRTEEKSAIELFHVGLKADVTKRCYTARLRQLLCDVFQDLFTGTLEERAQQLVDKTRLDPKWTVDLLLNLLDVCKQRIELPKNHPDYLDPETISNYLKPIKKLLEMNDVTISWKRIYASLPEVGSKNNGRGYTIEEIQSILKATADPVNHAIILVAASSGIRAGAFDFEWGDITPVYTGKNGLTLKESDTGQLVCATILIYKGSREEYLSFITPEAHDALMEHKKKWIQKVGRKPRPKDKVFKGRGSTGTLSDANLRLRVMRLTLKVGIRSNKKKRRHEIPTMNGFRRFWNKTVKNTKSIDVIGSLIKKERMMGHDGLISLDKNYYQALVLEFAKEYLTVVKELTITDEYRLKMENVKLKKERDEVLELAREAVSERNKAIETLREQLHEKKIVI